MAFCTNCGKQVNEGTRFCESCGKVVDVTQNEKNNQRKTVYDGEIHKCPNCGEVLNSFLTNCPSCGYELRGTSATNSVKELAKKLEELEAKRPPKKIHSMFSKPFNREQLSNIDEQKISLIKNFVIPNTKEDIMEFVVLASSNIDIKSYGLFGMQNQNINPAQRELSDAWLAKFEQAYEKAKLSFGETTEVIKIKNIYDKKNEQIVNNKKKIKLFWLGILAIFLIIPIVSLITIFSISSINTQKIETENERLEIIVEEVYDAIENDNFTLARAKASQIIFSDTTAVDGQQEAERWEKIRTDLIKVIDVAEKDSETYAIDSEPATSVSEEQTSTVEEPHTKSTEEIPSAFLEGYEKADFSKYNSPASENGLGGKRIYITGTLDKIEILEADGTQTILGYLVESGGYTWLIKMHAVPIVTATNFDEAIGKEVICTVVYDGYSEKKEMPSTTLNEIMILENGKTFFGMQKLLDE